MKMDLIAMSSETENNGVIYLLTSPSGKQYVGQTWDMVTRMSKYKRGYNQQPAIKSAIAKYGWDNFSVVIIACGIQTQEALDATEIAFIALLDTMSPHGYNLQAGGNGGKPCAETRAKMSVAQRNREPVSPETRAKISETKCGENNPNFGKTPSPETRAKMRAAKLGKSPSPEAVEKTAASNRGRPLSPEHRAKLSAANRGQKRSSDTRRKMSVAASARWARKQQDTKQTSLLL